MQKAPTKIVRSSKIPDNGMGNTCSQPTYLPDLANNYCQVPLNTYTPEIPQVCSPAGPISDPYHREICSAINAEEFARNSRGVGTGSCHYNDCNSHWVQGSGCCKGCCGIIGSSTQCYRTEFTGDPLECCLKDMFCTAGEGGNPDQCYSDANRTRTCSGGPGAPNNRSVVSTDCESNLMRYCTGTLPSDDPNSTAWLDRWTSGANNSCANIVLRKSYQLGGPNRCFIPPPVPPGAVGLCRNNPDAPIDANGYFWSQTLIQAAIDRYQSQGFVLGSMPGFQGFHPFQDFMYDNICCPYAGLCQAMLRGQGEGKNMQQLAGNPELTKWFGCYLPESEYQDYSVKYNIQPACTPVCNRVSTIPEVGINAIPVKCEQSVCIIDNVTANLLDTTVGGGVSVDQVCSGCTGASCTCMVSNVTIDVENSTINGFLVPVAEVCGSYTCQQTNPSAVGPSMITIPCDGTGSTNPFQAVEDQLIAQAIVAYRWNWVVTIIVVVVILLIIMVLVWLFYPRTAAKSSIDGSQTPITAVTRSSP